MLLSDADLDFAIRNIDRLSPQQKEQVLHLLDERKRLADLTNTREHFLPFVKAMWPDFIPGATTPSWLRSSSACSAASSSA